MTSGESYRRPRIFIGLALIDSKKKKSTMDIVPCLLHMPTRTLYPMNSAYDVVSAVKQLCSHHELRLPIDYVVEDVSIDEVHNGRLLQSELAEEVDELSFSDSESYEEVFDRVMEGLMNRSVLEVEDLFDQHILDENRFNPKDAESEFLEAILAKMKDQQEVVAIRKIFELYPTDAQDVVGEKIGFDSLAATYLDFSEIQEVLRQADPAFQNPMFGEEDFTYSLEDVPVELVEKYQLKDVSVLTAQINVITNGVNEVFHPKNVVRKGPVDSGCHDDALNFEDYSFMQCPPKSEQEIARELAKETMKAEASA